MAFTPLQNPTKIKKDNPQEALLANVQALMAQLSGATLEEAYLDKDGNLHLRMQTQAGVDLLKNQIKEPEFSKSGIFLQEKEMVLAGRNVISFCNVYCGFSVDETESLFKSVQVNDDLRKNLFKAFKLSTLVKPALPIEEVKLLSNEQMETNALALGFVDSALNAYKELYTTEKSYIESLRRIGIQERESLLRVYDELSPNEKKSFISKQEFNDLLTSFSKLESLQQTLIDNIQEDPLKIAQLLPQIQEEYGQYIKQYQAMIAKGGIPTMLNDVYRNDPQFKGQQLGSFLIQPTQRIMRYGMLYQEMEKRLPLDNLEKAKYVELITQINGAAQGVNVSVKAMNLEKSDMVVSLEIDKSEVDRRRAKEILRGFDTHNTNLSDDEKAKKISSQAGIIGLQGYEIEERKKSVLERVKSPKEAEFVVKSRKDGEPVFNVIINEGKISIKELKAGSLNESAYQQQLKDLNHLMEVLKGNVKNNPVVSAKSLDAALAIKQIGVNNKLINYNFSSGVKKLIESDLSNEVATQSITVNKSVPVVKIDYDDTLSKFYKEGIIKQIGDQALKHERESLRKQLQILVDEGVVVPELRIKRGGVSTSQSNIGYDGDTPSPFPIKITTSQPLLALKQFEAILAAGFTPKLEGKAAENVAKYVKEGVASNFDEKLKEQAGQVIKTEKHITVAGPLGEDGNIDGAQVLRRVIIATQNGLMVDLSIDSKIALHTYIGNLNAKELAKQCEISIPKGPEPIMMMRNLLELGIMPIVTSPAKGLKESVKKGEKLEICKIDSGNIEQDFKILKTTLGQLGMPVSVDGGRIKQHLKDAPQVTYIDLSNFSDADQIKQAQNLANMGISCMIKAKVPPNTELLITSANAKHAVQMFEKALNQGFLPRFNLSLEPEMEILLKQASQGVKIEGNDPKIIFDKVKQCMDIGLMPVLTEPQKQTLKEYAIKNPLALTVQGYHPSAIMGNIELANKLNIETKVTPVAQQIYASHIETTGQVPSIPLYPFEKEQTRFFFFKTKVVDFDRTLAHVKNLQSSHLFFHNSPEMDAVMTEVKAAIEKKPFFGKGFTKQANELREKFFKPFLEVQGKDEVVKMALQGQVKEAHQSSTTTRPTTSGESRPQPMISTLKSGPHPQGTGTTNPKSPKVPSRSEDPSKPKP